MGAGFDRTVPGTFFRRLPNYVTSAYWPDVEPGEERDGTRCEDLMAVTFTDERSFDLVVTSDIFEHVREPYVGFAEVHRVLRRGGGRHIFSLPVQAPMRCEQRSSVFDTSGDKDIFPVEPLYHHSGQHLVYNDFGERPRCRAP